MGEVENNLGLSPTDNVFDDSIHDSNKEIKVQKSDRDTDIDAWLDDLSIGELMDYLITYDPVG